MGAVIKTWIFHYDLFKIHEFCILRYNGFTKMCYCQDAKNLISLETN